MSDHVLLVLGTGQPLVFCNQVRVLTSITSASSLLIKEQQALDLADKMQFLVLLAYKSNIELKYLLPVAINFRVQ
jgi:hypothetical protein